MRLLLWFILMFSFLAIGFQDFLFAQPTLKQIVNIPWGTDKDYVRAVISKTSKGYIIASSLTIDHLGKGVKNNSFRVFTLDGRITFEFQPRQTQYFSADLIYNGTVYCHNFQDMVYRHRLETNTVDSMRVKFAPLIF